MDEWKDIVGFPYQINKDGLIMNKRTGRILKQYLDTVGYYQVTLCKDGKPVKFRIHRLLAIAFIPNPNNYPVVDHIDINCQNNDLSNLRWVTSQMNNCNTLRVSSSNERNIQITKYNTYRLSIPYKNIDKRFKTIEQAIEYRNSIIS
jgi:hypothetical protein